MSQIVFQLGPRIDDERSQEKPVLQEQSKVPSSQVIGLRRGSTSNGFHLIRRLATFKAIWPQGLEAVVLRSFHLPKQAAMILVFETRLVLEAMVL